MTTSVTSLQRRLWTAAIIGAPLLLSIAQFFWQEGKVTTIAGTLQVLSFALWVLAFQGMFNLIQKALPRYAVIGFALAVYACIGGNNFGVDGIYGEAMGLKTLAEFNELHAKIGFPTAVILFIPGTLFPLSMLLLGIQLVRTKRVSTLAGILLCIGAACFPLSRIPRIDILAHIDNVVLLMAHIVIALELSGSRKAIPSGQNQAVIG